jgi:hypothetical protein
MDGLAEKGIILLVVWRSLGAKVQVSSASLLLLAP